MLGKKNGFQKLLKDLLPSVFVLECVCRSFALCASHAVLVLPPFLESLVKDITSYFSRTNKRQNDFTTIQDVVQTRVGQLENFQLFQIRLELRL